MSEILSINAGIPHETVAAPLIFNVFTSNQPNTPHTITGNFANDKFF